MEELAARRDPDQRLVAHRRDSLLNRLLSLLLESGGRFVICACISPAADAAGVRLALAKETLRASDGLDGPLSPYSSPSPSPSSAGWSTDGRTDRCC